MPKYYTIKIWSINFEIKNWLCVNLILLWVLPCAETTSMSNSVLTARLKIVINLTGRVTQFCCEIVFDDYFQYERRVPSVFTPTLRHFNALVEPRQFSLGYFCALGLGNAQFVLSEISSTIVRQTNGLTITTEQYNKVVHIVALL